jgi:hypothetical protein
MGETRRHYGWRALRSPGDLVFIPARSDLEVRRVRMAAKRYGSRTGIRIRIRRGVRSGEPGLWAERQARNLVQDRARATSGSSALPFNHPGPWYPTPPGQVLETRDGGTWYRIVPGPGAREPE